MQPWADFGTAILKVMSILRLMTKTTNGFCYYGFINKHPLHCESQSARVAHAQD